MGPDDYVASAMALFDSYSFEMWFEEVVAVRGERLALLVRCLTQNEWEPIRSLVIVQYDAAVQLVERWVRFDPEQIEEALAVLDDMENSIGRTK